MAAATINDDIRQQVEHALHRGDFTTSERLYAQLLDSSCIGVDTEDAGALQVCADYALALYGLGDFAAGESQLRAPWRGRSASLLRLLENISSPAPPHLVVQ